MSDPSLALQGAIIEALIAHPAVAGGRVYDSVRPGAAFPYVTIGPSDSVGDDRECWDSSEVNVQVDVWSHEPGYVQAKQIAALVRERLKQTFSISGFLVTEATYLTTRFFRDPDGITSHGVVEFLYLVDHDT